jgi:hypothetical protein
MRTQGSDHEWTRLRRARRRSADSVRCAAGLGLRNPRTETGVVPPARERAAPEGSRRVLESAERARSPAWLSLGWARALGREGRSRRAHHARGRDGQRVPVPPASERRVRSIEAREWALQAAVGPARRRYRAAQLGEAERRGDRPAPEARRCLRRAGRCRRSHRRERGGVLRRRAGHSLGETPRALPRARPSVARPRPRVRAVLTRAWDEIRHVEATRRCRLA